MIWKIWDDNGKKFVHIKKMQKYQNRLNFTFQDTFTSMTIKSLCADTEKVLCTASCLVNEKTQNIISNVTILTVTGWFGKLDIKCYKRHYDVYIWP